MSEKMSKEEFRGMAGWNSYLKSIPNFPTYFFDFFEKIAYPQGEETKINPQRASFSCDSVEKLGFLFLSLEAIQEIDKAAHELAPISLGSPAQFQLTSFLSQEKYHAYMFIWSTRSLIDALSVHLNDFYKLEQKSSSIWLGNTNFIKELKQKRPKFTEKLDGYFQWLKDVDKYRLYSIHREPLLIIPNGDPWYEREWELSMPQSPEGSLTKFIRKEEVKLVALLPVLQQWLKNSADLTQYVYEDTLDSFSNPRF